MKVLHLFQEYLPNSESWAFNLISCCVNTKINIGAIYHSESKNYFSKRFGFVNHGHEEILQKFYKNPKEISKSDNFFLRLSRIFNKKEISHLDRWIRTNNPDLIHIHFATTAVHFISILVKENRKFVVSFYGYDYEKAIYDQPDIINVYEIIFRKAAAIFTEGEFGKKILIKQGCDPNKIFIVKLGVKVDEIPYLIRPRSQITKFVQVANFVPKKGQINLLKSIHKLSPECLKKSHFTFIGDSKTKYGIQFNNLVKQYKLSSQIEVLAPISYVNLHHELIKHDVFVHPSHYSDENDCEGGAPTVMLDAQATGLPVISTLHCDIPNYVSNASMQYLTKENEDSELALTLERFLRMENDQYLELRRAAREHIELNYNIKKNSLYLEKIYKDIISLKS